MLLTLAASSLASKLANGSRRGEMRLTDLPRFAREHLGLYGLNVSTSLLVGADFEMLDALRDAADKAQCPCLVLIEPTPLDLADLDEDRGDAAMDRVTRVIRAAQRLGCNSAAISIAGPDDEEAFDHAVERLKTLLSRAERVEVNLLIASGDGLTRSPERLTDLIKRVGGFRIGTFPDYEAAAASDDPEQFLRRLTPYASALTASSMEFKKSRKAPGVVHEGFDIVAYTKIVESVGYQGTLAIDFRGKSDPVEGVLSTKRLLQTALGMEEEDGS